MKKNSLSLAQRIARLLVPIPPKSQRAFKVSSQTGQRVAGYDIEITLKRERTQFEEGLQVEEIPIHISQAGSPYLLAEDASAKYKLSLERIRQLCRNERIVCLKKSGRWIVHEESLRAHCVTV